MGTQVHIRVRPNQPGLIPGYPRSLSDVLTLEVPGYIIEYEQNNQVLVAGYPISLSRAFALWVPGYTLEYPGYMPEYDQNDHIFVPVYLKVCFLLLISHAFFFNS